MTKRLMVLIALLCGYSTAQYIPVVATSCIKDASGSLITSGTFTVQATDDQNRPLAFRIDTTTGQAITAPVVWTITTGTLSAGAGTLQLADPAQTQPLNIKYHFAIKNLATGNITNYSLVNVTINDGAGHFDFCRANLYLGSALNTPVLLTGPAGSGCTGISGGPCVVENPSAGVSQTIKGQLICKIFLNIRCIDPTNAQAWAGSDLGAWINSAISDCASTSSGGDNGGTNGGGNCKIHVTSGTYAESVGAIITNGVHINGDGQNATYVKCTGSIDAFTFNNSTRSSLEGLSIDSTTCGAAVKVAGGFFNRIYNIAIGVTDSVAGHGFQKGVWVTKSAGGQFAFSTFIDTVNPANIAAGGCAYCLDHFNDLHINHAIAAIGLDVTTGTDVLIDSGASGLYINDLSTVFGQHGLKIQHTFVDGSGPPIFLFFDKFLADTTPGGDACLLDATLGSNVLNSTFTNSWCAGAGKNNAGSIVTAGSNGLHISGGTGIWFTAGGKIRANAGNGVLIDNANVGFVTIENSAITGNNQDSAVDQHGIYITAAASNIQIVQNKIGNTLDGGGQKFGLKVAALAVNGLQVANNNFNSNTTGPISNANTLSTTQVGNLPNQNGSTTIAAAATTVTVTNPWVTATSQILISEDSSLGTALSVTCNTTAGRTYAVTTRTPGTSFVITSSGAPVTNPACLSYSIQ